MANAINWFEIPATNFDRAKNFYSEIFKAEMALNNINGLEMAFLNAPEGGVGGAIVKGESYIPSKEGTLPYLNGGENLATVLDRVESAGGTVVMPKTQISEEVGYMAVFMDTEGNRIALHSPN